ncbi:MAG: response regulator [Candidatus Omnitrophota bacterium]
MAKILVVDDEIYIRELLQKALKLNGYEAITVPSADQALDIIFKEPLDLVLLDIELAGESGISVLKKIREFQKKMPVVIYSGILTPQIEKEVREAGANEALSKKTEIPQLVEQLGRILNAQTRMAPGPSGKREKSVLIVDDETGIRNMLKSFFQTKGYRTLEAGSGEEALRIAGGEKFSMALLDMNMTGIDGLETLKGLLGINPKLGVVMVTSDQDDGKVQKAIELGAYGYVLKPFDFLYLELVVMSKLAIAENE